MTTITHPNGRSAAIEFMADDLTSSKWHYQVYWEDGCDMDYGSVRSWHEAMQAVTGVLDDENLSNYDTHDHDLMLGECKWLGWQEETDNDNDDDREGVWYLTIVDGDGEELSVIVHRTVGGKYPLDGDVARRKVMVAERIVRALNAYKEEA